MIKITYCKKRLALGLILLTYAPLCPAFLTERTLGIYRTFLSQMMEDNPLILEYLERISRASEHTAVSRIRKRLSKTPILVLTGDEKAMEEAA